MAREITYLQTLERSSKRLSLRESPRPKSSIPFFAFPLGLIALHFLAPRPNDERAIFIGILALLLVFIGVNRLLATVGTFDSVSGRITVARKFGSTTVFARHFRISDVLRVFHDERSYLRLKTQNPVLELLSGERVKLSQWCPIKTDLETQVGAANRLIHSYKQTQLMSAGKPTQTFSQAIGEATPRQWNLERLNLLDDFNRRRTIRLIKFSIVCLILSMASLAMSGPNLPTILWILRSFVIVASLVSTLWLAGVLLLDWSLRRRGSFSLPHS